MSILTSYILQDYSHTTPAQKYPVNQNLLILDRVIFLTVIEKAVKRNVNSKVLCELYQRMCLFLSRGAYPGDGIDEDDEN